MTRTRPSFRLLLLAAVPVVAVAGCTTLAEDDRALLVEARDSAKAAEQTANEALAVARQAQQDAQRASSEAKEANERADRMFQAQQRK